MAVAKLAEHVPLLLLLIITQTWALVLLGVLPLISSGYNVIPSLGCCNPMRDRHEQWMQTHNKSYKDASEQEHRCCVYQANVHFIEGFNSHDFGFKLTDNKFADLTNGEFLQKYRCLGTSVGTENKEVQQNQKKKKNYNCQNISDRPPVDWRDHGAITAVKDQGQCGSCWAFSAVASIEAANKIKNNATLVSLSEQELIDCDTSGSSSGCAGGFMTQAFDFVQRNNGLTNDTNYPYTGVQEKQCNKSKVVSPLVSIKGYMNVTSNSEENLADAVTGQPVSVAIDAGGYLFQFYSSGVYHGPCGTNLNHGVTLVGFGTNSNDGNYWIVKNSWGADWGEGGYIRMARGVSYSEGICGITLKASYPIL